MTDHQTAQQVDPERVSELVASLTYETARVPNTSSTIATARLPNGFVVAIGHSSCVSPAAYHAETQRKLAIGAAAGKARDALFEFEAYRLAHDLANGVANP